MEVLQTLNVDVTNDMSTVDQESTEKKSGAVKRTTAKKAAATPKEPSARAAKAAAEAVKPVREANPAKSSLLADFFGAGTKPPQRVEDMKRELRVESRPLQERRPLVDRSHPAGQLERPSAAERPARTVVERSAVERPAQAAPVAATRSERPAKSGNPATRRTAAVQAPIEVVEQVQVQAPAPVTEEVLTESPATEPVREIPVVEVAVEVAQDAAPARKEPVVDDVVEETTPLSRDLDQVQSPVARVLPSGPASGLRLGVPGPSRPATGNVGLPSRPVPSGPAAGPTGLSGLDGPRRPAPPGPSTPGLGLPSKSVPGAQLERPRMAGPGAAFGPRPAGPGIGRPGPPGMGPRPAGPPLGAPTRGGFGGGNRTRNGQLNIPKVDPKVAENAKPAEGKRPIGQGGDRKRGDAFTKRETSASRPSEEKLFGRRPSFGQRTSVVDRRSQKPITIEGSLTVKDFAHEMGVTASEVIKKLLTGYGIMATINQELDPDTCVLIGGEFGIDVTVNEVVSVIEEYDVVIQADEAPELLAARHPVVTIMGHVDHGKTSLLDAIRSAKVAVGEAGGITQHIGAYEVELNGRKITFLDTPGHEAFTAMRARGANATDIAILVVAADDSVMPQTVESIAHAKAAGVPVLVAINKVDKEGSNPQKVKQDLTAHGLVAEEWGGETIMVPVSAKMQIGLDLLLENVLILADMQELKANPDKEARGTILEAELDKARGPLATVLVQAGTLNTGDTFVAGTAWGRVRAMFDHRGRKLKTAGPSTPVRVIGFNSIPSAGDIFRVAPDERTAKDVAEKRVVRLQAERQGSKAMSLDDFMTKVAEGEVKDLNLIIKGDMQGSVEALRGQLEKLKNDEVQVRIVHGAVGAITETDVMLASASKAIVIGFSVRPDDRASRAAADQGVDIRLYDVIYNVVDDIKAALTGMLAPVIEENILGRAEVRETFKVPKVGMAAGCMVVNGKITRNAKYRLIRDGIVVWTGEVNALRRFKDEAKEVAEGYECGVTLERFQDFKMGDILEAYEMKEVKAG